jgi:hypothetical protein
MGFEGVERGSVEPVGGGIHQICDNISVDDLVKKRWGGIGSLIALLEVISPKVEEVEERLKCEAGSVAYEIGERSERIEMFQVAYRRRACLDLQKNYLKHLKYETSKIILRCSQQSRSSQNMKVNPSAL